MFVCLFLFVLVLFSLCVFLVVCVLSIVICFLSVVIHCTVARSCVCVFCLVFQNSLLCVL